MPAGDSMPDTYIAIMLQSLKKKEQVLDEIIRLDDRQKDTLTDPECPFDVFDETVEAKSACIDQLNQLDRWQKNWIRTVKIMQRKFVTCSSAFAG